MANRTDTPRKASRSKKTAKRLATKYARRMIKKAKLARRRS